MVKANSWLRSRITVKVKRMIVKDTDEYQPGSVITPIGSDSSTSDGFDTSAAVLDELHAWRKYHHEHYEKMTTAGGSRRQEVVWFFTTASVFLFNPYFFYGFILAIPYYYYGY